ncbi:XRE family transcriptional regulator [Streptomyces lunaelactis]|uniref:XRE family transcriptional regulator n=2 Tax=Streptomyces lunaelactis TaxID=1535768 RepID=UPI0015844E5A|nr:helix-turn-helix domain-containing protein [Streptomyces lunaelactis]NUK20181.1 helix-turn-helix domain-containing protein [Streptomyces lunaelactis]
MGRQEKELSARVPAMAEVARWLRRSRRLSGRTYAQLARATGFSTSRLHRAANGCPVPWPVVEAFARACGADVEEAKTVWLQAQVARPSGSSPAGRIRVDEISTFAELREAMRALRAEHDDPSLRDLERRAGTGMLPRTTLNEALRGTTRPRKEVVLTFVRALRVSEDAAKSWAAAWDRADQNHRAPQADRQILRVSPSPHLLRALSDIPMAEWNCFAELVDNALAAHASARGSRFAHPGDPLPVSIDFHEDADSPERNAVTIYDHGPGMDSESLLHALRIGWTGNKRQQRTLGLGFNIATCRLGFHVTVRTAQPDAAAWTVLTLDLRVLAHGANWRVPVNTEPKTMAGEHGTRITISDLRGRWPAGRQGQLRDKLGDIYSYLIREERLRLVVNGRAVSPRMPCIWGEDRSVPHRGGHVPARQSIDVTVATVHHCADCGHTCALEAERCNECHGRRLAPLAQRVWGWVGVQRYLHTTDYGIDFYRHGRKILTRDKSLFTWQGDMGDASLEYPVEVPGGKGRIVGEIHCDHMPVTVTKDSFVFDSAQWRTVVHTVRGQGPLSPLKSQKFGYPPNTSPLAVIYQAYRRNDPGLRYLIPGDGRRALHEGAAEWSRCFHRGLPEYQSDDIWYQAAADHETQRQG